MLVVAGCGGGGARPPAPERPADHGPMQHGGPPIEDPGEPPAPLILDEPPSAAHGDDVIAPPGATAASKAHYDAAVVAYDLADFQGAIDGFTRAYETEPRSEYLFDLAQAYRLLGHVKQALFFYKRYATLSAREVGTTPVDVSLTIEDLEEILASHQP